MQVINNILNDNISPEDFFAYCYGILATPKYVKEFWHELETPGSRIPITKNRDLFIKLVEIGRTLVWLHTYCERLIPSGKKPGKIPVGRVRCQIGIPNTVNDYPTEFAYDVGTQELKVGRGVFENVRPEVYNFSVSGLEVVKSWLAYRMRDGAGKKSSPLDDIRPQTWQFDHELLDLLWVLDATVDLYPELSSLFDEVIKSELFTSTEFPQPTELEKSNSLEVKSELPFLNLEEVDEEDE